MQKAERKEFYGFVAIIAILAATQLYSIYHSLTAEIALTFKHYLGFLSTILLTVLLFLRPNWLFYALGLILVLGSENILGFTPTLDFTQTRYYFDSLTLPVSYQSFSLYMLVLWAMFSYNRLAHLGRSVLARPNR